MISYHMRFAVPTRMSLTLGVFALLAGTASLRADSVCLGTGQNRVAGCNFVSGAGGIEDLDWNFVGSDLQSEESFNPDNPYTSPQGHGKQDSLNNTSEGGAGGWSGAGAWSGAGGSGGDAWLGGDDPGSSGGGSGSGPTIKDFLSGVNGSDGDGWTGATGPLDDPSPVPEPAYSGLFALAAGLCILAGARRRSKAQN